MILGHNGEHRRALPSTPYGKEKTARLGEVIGFILRDAVAMQANLSVFETHIASHKDLLDTGNAARDTAGAYIRAIDARASYARAYNGIMISARYVIGAEVQLRLTAVEANDVVGEGLLRAVNYKDGTLLLASQDNPKQVVDFASAEFTGEALSRRYESTALNVDFEVLNPETPSLHPFVVAYRL